MEPGADNTQSRFIHALRKQLAEPCLEVPLPCPWGHYELTFETRQHLLEHVRIDHRSKTAGLGDAWTRVTLEEAIRKLRPPESDLLNPDLRRLTLDSDNERRTSPSSGRKRPAESEFRTRRHELPSAVQLSDADFSRDILWPGNAERTQADSRLCNYRNPEQAVRRATSSSQVHDSHSRAPIPPTRRNEPATTASSRQPGLIELQKYDPRYPGLLLQPDSRPISQEQLAAEVKSIYAGLTMVETKCIHVNRALAAAPRDKTQESAPDYWQALIKLYRDKLYKDDFSLTSRYASAGSALRKLAEKHTTLHQRDRDAKTVFEILELLLERIAYLEQAQRTLAASAGGQHEVNNRPSARGTSTYEIPSVIRSGGRQLELNALGDTGAKVNFMSPACAAKLNLVINNSRSKSVKVASGATVRTVGFVDMVFQFRDEPDSQHPLRFHILPSIVQELVLGKKFLQATATFSNAANMARRVKETFTRTLKETMNRLLYLGASGPSFTGVLNGKSVKAFADTGSDVLVMDEAFANSLGLPIHKGAKHEIPLTFADGSKKRTSGSVSHVEWRFGTADDTPHFLDFFVLENAPAPVILSNFFLFDTKAYTEYDCYYVDDDYEGDDDDDDDDNEMLFFLITRSDYDAKGKIDWSSIKAKELEEQVRRNRVDDKISRLRGTARDDARVEETELRSRKDNELQALRDRQAADDQAAAPVPAPGPAVNIPPGPLVAVSGNQKWYRFKLKRRKKPSPTGANIPNGTSPCRTSLD